MSDDRRELPVKMTLPELPKDDAVKESLLREMLEVERKRIESMDRKTEVQRLQIEATLSATKLNLELNAKHLADESAHKFRKYILGRNISLFVGVSAVLLISVLLYFSFMGTPEQSARATQFLQMVLVGVGGYGVISGAIGLMKKLFD